MYHIKKKWRMIVQTYVKKVQSLPGWKLKHEIMINDSKLNPNIAKHLNKAKTHRYLRGLRMCTFMTDDFCFKCKEKFSINSYGDTPFGNQAWYIDTLRNSPWTPEHINRTGWQFAPVFYVLNETFDLCLQRVEVGFIILFKMSRFMCRC